MAFEEIKKVLEAKGYKVATFETAAEATAYMSKEIQNTTVGIGGSVTVNEMGLYDALVASNNEVHWHWVGGMEELPKEDEAEIYITSVNGMAETGEIINIDGIGNRVCSSIYGHKKVYFVVGRNKLAPTYDEALWRARNIAAPKNAQRLGRKTPCAVKADRCYDCKSPERICRALTVLWQATTNSNMEVVLINEDLGY